MLMLGMMMIICIALRSLCFLRILRLAFRLRLLLVVQRVAQHRRQLISNLLRIGGGVRASRIASSCYSGCSGDESTGCSRRSAAVASSSSDGSCVATRWVRQHDIQGSGSGGSDGITGTNASSARLVFSSLATATLATARGSGGGIRSERRRLLRRELRRPSRLLRRLLLLGCFQLGLRSQQPLPKCHSVIMI
jgi:hypothetical protein